MTVYSARVTINGRDCTAPPDTTKYAVYLAFNKVTCKFYIGATSRSMKVRRGQHLSSARNGLRGRFPAAIREYGAENFQWNVLVECADFKDALEKERYFIKLLKPQYNMTSGGQGALGYKHNDHSILKMILKKIGKKVTDPVLLEKHRTNLAKYRELRKRRVRCLIDGKEYPCATEASAAYGLDISGIHKSCKTSLRGRHNKIKKNSVAFEYVEI